MKRRTLSRLFAMTSLCMLLVTFAGFFATSADAGEFNFGKTRTVMAALASHAGTDVLCEQHQAEAIALEDSQHRGMPITLAAFQSGGSTAASASAVAPQTVPVQSTSAFIQATAAQAAAARALQQQQNQQQQSRGCRF